MDEIYFAVGPETWGRGTTEEEAVKNCKVNWPHWAGRFNKRKLAIFCTTDKDAYIDGMDGTLFAERGTTRQIQKAGGEREIE